jgi:diguanylate cyclase (GGDEF)-like protein
MSSELASEALRGELSRLRAMSDAIVEGIAVLSTDGTLLEANLGLGTLIGLDARALIGRPMTDLFAVEPPVMPPAMGSVEVTLAGGDGSALPAQLHVRTIELLGRRHVMLAFEDLRARRATEERISRNARHDPLTGLRNRLGLEQAMLAEQTRAERYGADFAVLCLDLDGFKAINDVHGHPAGDEALRIVAQRLTEVTRETDLAFRLGGDEFLILQAYTAEAHQSARLAERLVEAIGRPFFIGDAALNLGVSIGIAHFPAHGRNVEELMRNADAALYKAKHEGKNTHRFFDPSLNEALQRRRAIEAELMHAIDRSELDLIYEPQMEVASGAVIGFDARLRWNSSKLGPVDPSVFVPIAEDAGLMTALGEWTIYEACRQAATWARPLGVGLKISLFQFNSGDLALTFVQALRASNLDPSRLRVDLSEATLTQGGKRVTETLAKLRSLRVKLGLDEFGTGPASINALHEGAFDQVKLDPAALREDDETVRRLRAMIAVGGVFGLQIAAAGVATPALRDRIAGLGCQVVQGEVVSPPRSIQAFAPFTGAAGAPKPGASGTLAAMRELLSQFQPATLPVLVVDDSEMVGDTLTAMLSAFGFAQVDRAVDGGTALEKLRRRSYGLVISDWNMAPMSGIELLNRVRAEPALRGLRFLMLTANARSASRIEARNAGVDGFLVKPFRPDALAQKIREILSVPQNLDRAG